jgi:hypothetical protein
VTRPSRRSGPAAWNKGDDRETEGDQHEPGTQLTKLRALRPLRRATLRLSSEPSHLDSSGGRSKQCVDTHVRCSKAARSYQRARKNRHYRQHQPPTKNTHDHASNKAPDCDANHTANGESPPNPPRARARVLLGVGVCAEGVSVLFGRPVRVCAQTIREHEPLCRGLRKLRHARTSGARSLSTACGVLKWGHRSHRERHR